MALSLEQEAILARFAAQTERKREGKEAGDIVCVDFSVPEAAEFLGISAASARPKLAALAEAGELDAIGDRAPRYALPSERARASHARIEHADALALDGGTLEALRERCAVLAGQVSELAGTVGLKAQEHPARRVAVLRDELVDAEVALVRALRSIGVGR